MAGEASCWKKIKPWFFKYTISLATGNIRQLICDTNFLKEKRYGERIVNRGWSSVYNIFCIYFVNLSRVFILWNRIIISQVSAARADGRFVNSDQQKKVNVKIFENVNVEKTIQSWDLKNANVTIILLFYFAIYMLKSTIVYFSLSITMSWFLFETPVQ